MAGSTAAILRPGGKTKDRDTKILMVALSRHQLGGASGPPFAYGIVFSVVDS